MGEFFFSFFLFWREEGSSCFFFVCLLFTKEGSRQQLQCLGVFFFLTSCLGVCCWAGGTSLSVFVFWWPTTAAGPWETPSTVVLLGRRRHQRHRAPEPDTPPTPSTTLLLNLAMRTTPRPLVCSIPRLSPPRHRSPSIPFQWGRAFFFIIIESPALPPFETHAAVTAPRY